MDCLFCKIVNGEIPTDIVYQDDQVLAFRDISPQAPTHMLIIPKLHITTINDMNIEDGPLLGHMIFTAKNLAAKEGLADDGFRLTINCNEQGGQSVYHIHLHLLGGRKMTWPPG
jgi:histidine triad (HIT) family protein